MGLVAKAFQDLITFSRASSGTYVNSNGYITNSSVLNYLTYSNQPENAAWTKSNSFVQQNLLTYSEQFDNAAWIKSNATVTANATIAPDGTLTADELLDTVANTNHFVSETPTLSAGVHTVSIYAKANARRRIMLRENSFLGGAGIFDLISGTVVASIGAATASISSIGGGWYRCSVVNPSLPGGATQFGVYVMPDAATVVADAVYIGTGTGLYIWGSQLVQGSVPGNYQATTSAALPVLYADYNGALRARKLCEDSATNFHYIAATGVTAASTVYTGGVRVKAGERTWVALSAHGIVNGTAYFNLSTGVVGTIGAGISGTSIAPAGNGYFFCTITYTATGTANALDVLPASADNTANYAGNGSSGIYIADAQLNDGSSALAYYNTDANAYNAPRFDYDPVTLAAKGLLVEESRANLLTYSNGFTTAPWTVRGTATATPNAALSPDGTNNAWLIAGINVLTNDVFQQITVASGVAYSPSFYIKKVTATGTLQVANPAGTNGSMNINFALLGSGWERITTSHPAVTVTTAFAGSAGNLGGLHLLAPTTGPLSFYLYGSQCELGAFSTSYIPTVASQVTRAADVASVNTLSPWFNSVSGTLYAEGTSFVPDADGIVRMMATLTDTISYTNAIRLERLTGTWRDVQTVSGVAASIAGTWTFGQLGKLAGAYQSSNSAGTFNAAVPQSVGTATMPSGIAYLALGGNGLGSANQWNGHLRRITYYPRRLTNAELQTLTTL